MTMAKNLAKALAGGAFKALELLSHCVVIGMGLGAGFWISTWLMFR